MGLRLAVAPALALVLFVLVVESGDLRPLGLADDLAKLTVPIQIIWGAKDAIIPAAHAKALPNARVEVIGTAGHMAQMEAAGRVNELVKAQITR